MKVWVQVHSGGHIRTLQLLGTVVWCKPGNGPGSFLIGVRLRARPQEPMKVWADTMLDELRHFGGADLHY